ncbi:MAG: aminotransferase class I/II-fold pyridoxal phosphate-dependent enzyme [Gammaproteobacteria bacterium]
MDSNLSKELDDFKSLNLNIDVTRGKPHSVQLDLSQSILIDPLKSWIVDGVDIRNYGEPLGLLRARRLGSEILQSPLEYTLAAEQSSLLLIYQLVSALYLHGLATPWKSLSPAKIICPVPGFDRHFRIFEDFGIQMLSVPLEGDGPNLQYLRDLLEKEKDVVGIITVPKHSNPSGDIYSEHKIREIFKLGKEYSDDFCFINDNSYIVHDFEDGLINHPILKIAEEEGVENNCALMTSFSKITFGGGGLSFFSAGKKLFELMVRQRGVMIICPDKINQQRHLQFLSSLDDIKKHMKLHADVIVPKFNLVKDKLSKLPSHLGSYVYPKGGYFISFNTTNPIASRVIEICNSAGVKFTPAGATYPYGKDPLDSNIRIAPTFLTLDELSLAMDVFVLALRIADSGSN